VSVFDVAWTWGSTPEERAQAYPCDRWLDRVDDAYFRAVTVRAVPRVVFRWLCQLKVAPYSYDWIDNLGRQSPRTLTPGVERLVVGERFMTIFTLVEFEPDRHVTLRLRKSRVFPDIVLSYVTEQAGPGTSRLLMKFVARYPVGIGGLLQRWWLPWGDLVMARRQLLNLRDLAEGGR
jgi:hypothetical protein